MESDLLHNKILVKYLLYFSYFMVINSILAVIYLIFAICSIE